MESDTRSASWHPAMMPNYNTETQSTDPELDSSRHQPLPSPLPPADDEPTDEVKPDIPNHQLPQDDTQPQTSSDAAFLDQFNDDEQSGTAAWDLSEPAPASAAEHDDVPAPNDEHVPAVTEPATTNTAKHSSTVSFARTVSHEVSFGDDEDTDWNIQRTETDPFEFMPPIERTNSFPVVPQVESTTEEPIDHPLPASQAQDILQELEQADSHADSAARLDFPGTSDEDQGNQEPTVNHTVQQYVGGDLVGTGEEASEARFEEGMPLIPQEESDTPVTKEEPKASGFDDAFAQDDTVASGDDFFSQIHGGSQPEEENPFEFALHRKSTTMVIGDSTGNDLDSELPTPMEGVASKEQESSDSSTQKAVNGDSAALPSEETGPKPETNDLDAKWATAFGDDDGDNPKLETKDLDAKWAAAFEDDDDGDFLLDSATENKELDPAEIFGSDDEGFLEDVEETPSAPLTTAPQTAAQPSQPGLNGRYAPENLQQQPQSVPNPYAPAPAFSQMQAPALQQHPSYTHPGTAPPMGMGYAPPPPPPKPEMTKAQSFASKSKGGYQSPYDLPMDVVKPKKRPSMQQTPRANTTPMPPPAGPPRSASMYNQPPPTGGSNTSMSPTGSSHSNQQPPLSPQRSTPQLRSKGSFFEDLPMPSRPRPTSRQSSLHSPSQHSPLGLGQPQAPPRGPLGPSMMPPSQPPVLSPPVLSPPAQRRLSQEQPAGLASLVAPDRVSPYAPLQPNAQIKPSAPSMANNRYSPAPAQVPGANGVPPPPASTSRYSPAPPISRTASTGYTAVPPPALAHQPRTSSPLAYFEVAHDKHPNKLSSPTHGEGPPLSRASSSQYEPRITRVPSLPTTQEVEEEQSPMRSPQTISKVPAAVTSPETRYTPGPARHTPPPIGIPPSNVLSPPMGISPSNILSPPKRSMSGYLPQPPASMLHKEVNFAPPPRSQTQSPGALYGRAGGRSDPVPRPSSVQGATSPRGVPHHEPPHPTVRARGMSQHLNLVPPADGRELDPLQRWRGAPLIAWGVGGLLVSSFPKDVPRYGISQALPQIIRSPGEVKVKHIKDIQPLEERLAKFPGPLKGKSKKKETLAWLTAGIEGLEGSLPHASFQQLVSHEDKRAIERLLLWRILRVFVENDGVLEGNPTVDKAVREIISPGLEGSNPELVSAISAGANLTGMTSPVTALQSDAVDSTAVEQVRRSLLSGDREKAVWAAVDKRLWGHAMLISNTLQSAELYKQVAQEFIKKEVNHPGQGNESLAALYGVLSGNFDESVDELVPVHARAGLQLMSTSVAAGASQDGLAGLDKWRETLGMILSNRSQGDPQALKSLGNLLSGYGRAEAAHICYIFARYQTVFGGLDDPNANFVLVGADHRHQADQFAKETEALQLSEVYEYGLSLAGGSNVTHSCPHLAAYKLQHAMILAEYGLRDKALQYCDGIYTAITAQTKRSPYYHSMLESSVDDLMRRLKQAPKEESSSWIPKPRMDQVSSTVWSRFNKFVAGDDDENSGNAAAGEAGGESGPFARIAGGTPTISRSPSVSNFEMYGSGTSPTIPASGTASRYAPGASQPSGSPYDPSSSYNPAPRSSMERTSGEMNRSSLDIPRRGSDMQSTYGNPYAPASGYQPSPLVAPQSSPYMPSAQGSPPAPLSLQHSGNSYSGYQPYGGAQVSPSANASQPYGGSQPAPKIEAPANEDSANSGYQAPSYGYDPPSMTFEPPSAQPEPPKDDYFQPSSFEPPSYQPDPADEPDSPSESKPKKKSFMDDDEDDIPALRPPQEKSKSDKDRENEEMFRKVAEEEAKRAAEAKTAKKGWGFGGWFGGGKKESLDQPAANKPIKAKLGEASSFVYDPDLKRWVNKKPGAENTPAKTATPPPPRAASRTGTPPPPRAPSAPPPPGSPNVRPTPAMGLNKTVSTESLNVPGGPPMMTRTVSNQSTASAPGGPPIAPPSRPATSLSNASSIDDLLGAAGGARKGAKKPRRSGRYVDVMAK